MKKGIILTWSAIILLIYILCCLLFLHITAEAGKTVKEQGKSEPLTILEDCAFQTEITEIPEAGMQRYIYIGSYNGGFKEFPVSIDGEVTPEKIISEIAELTGWNLELADNVFSGKGGMAVCFSKACSLLTGPPMNQKEEFTVYDNFGLAQLILDSVQESLRRNFVQVPGNAENLDIWYSIEDTPIEIEGTLISMEKPWSEQELFG